MVIKDLGVVTAYGYAVEGGYQGTEAEFMELLANARGIVSIVLTATDGLVKTYTILYTDGTTTTFQVRDGQDGDITENRVMEILMDYAKKEGTYEELTSGSAKQLLSKQYTEDSVPYNFRTSGGSLDIGDREFDKLVGLSLPWNQLFGSAYSRSLDAYGVVFTRDATTKKYTLTGQANASSNLWLDAIHNPVIGHKYLVCKVGGSADVYCVPANGAAVYGNSVVSFNVDDHFYVGVRIVNGTVYNEAFSITVCDLTQLFGSTIADYIYSLETATAGAGVAWFKKFFPKQYYSYNSGEIESVKVSSHDMVGFNQWDEEWENGYYGDSGGTIIKLSSSDVIRSKLIPVLPNTTYVLYCDDSNYAQGFFIGMIEDATTMKGYGISRTNVNLKEVTTGANTHYMCFAMGGNYGATYKNNICVHLKWDDSRNGEYEPYKKNSYALDPIELRGILKLDSNNEPYADGDTYEADGTVTRRWNEVDLGDLTWSKSSYITNGFVSTGNVPSDFPTGTTETTPKWINSKGYENRSEYSVENGNYDKCITYRISVGNTGVIIKDSAYATLYANNDMAGFKSAMSGVKLVYDKATPTTESADPFTDPQTVDNWGTEQYVDKAYTDGDRDVEIPVGHETKYPMNLRDKLETSPNAPTSDGDYIVHCESGQLTYIALGSTTTIQNIIARLEALEG